MAACACTCRHKCLRIPVLFFGARTSVRSICHVVKNRRSILFAATKSVEASANSTWAVIRGTETILQNLHDVSHLPWWALILVSTATLRTVITLPLAVHQNRVVAKMELLQPMLKEYGEAIKHRVVGRCRREGLPVEEANRRMKKEVSDEIVEICSAECELCNGSRFVR